MSKVKMLKKIIKIENMTSKALLFIPNHTKTKSLAIFAHGYTSHKESLLSWAFRLSSSGIPAAILDLPGHYLGSFEDVENFDTFKQHSHKIFSECLNFFDELNIYKNQNHIFLGGHSLGALLALKATQLKELSHSKISTICVGLAMPSKEKDHIYQSSFFEDMIKMRSLLVSPCLNPDNMFKWIKQEKENLTIKNQNIFLLTGQDDFIATPSFTNLLKLNLEKLGNNVQLKINKTLPHHRPELATAHIYSYVKNVLNL